MGRGDLSRRTRLSSKALRLYAVRGLLRPARVDPQNGYWYCGAEQEAEARLILLRGLDMPLDRIAAVLTEHPDRRADLLAHYWAGAEATRLAQRHLASSVMSHLAQGKEEQMDVRTRTCDTMTYVTERRRLRPEEIPDVIRSSCDRLARVAEEFGGWAGPLTTIYRSPVNDDTDGVVENAIPVRSGVLPSDVPGGTNILVEAAGEVAYVRITQAEVMSPQILTAYEEVYAWLSREGLTPSLPPREIYFAPFDDAHPEAEVCDIAVPFLR
ncbi:MerR family transcriptional regulator [Arthrobacter sp. MDT1-65]